MTIGAGNSRGRADSSFASAPGPPADAPTATRISSASGGGATAGNGMTRTRPVHAVIWSPMLLSFFSNGTAPACGSIESNAGVSIASTAPYPMASNTPDAFAPTLTVTTRIAQGVSAMMRRVASTPFMPGMISSIRMMSGRSRAHFATACAPSCATQMTWWSGFNRTARRSASATVGMSLTIPILMRWPRRSDPPLRAAVSRHESWPWSGSSQRRHRGRDGGLLRGPCRRRSLPGWTSDQGLS